jgi:erythromycin esterase
VALVTGELRDCTTALATLDPQAPLDDLRSLDDVIGDARVVAVGEAAHGGREFGLLRHRLARYCVERLGFDTVALESGFTESAALEPYLDGGMDDVVEAARRGVTFGMSRSRALTGLLEWARSLRELGRELTVVGIDVPGSAGTPLPALRAVEQYLRKWAPEDCDVVDRIVALAEACQADIPTASLARHADLPTAERDSLTAGLTELSARFASLQPRYAQRSGQPAFDRVTREVELARAQDLLARTMTPSPLLKGTNPRDAAMAATVRSLLDERPSRRIVLLAHNGHVQRTPHVTAPDTPGVPACGNHLAHALGSDYVAFGLTGGSGEVLAYATRPDLPGGVGMTVGHLGPPPAGTIEDLLARTTQGLVLVDLRAARSDPAARSALAACRKIRSADVLLDLDPAAAFDAVVHVPEVSIDAAYRYTDDADEVLFDEALGHRLWGI